MKSALKHYGEMLQRIRESGTYKNERIITTPQKARIDTTEAKNVLNMCANNYLPWPFRQQGAYRGRKGQL